MSFPPVSHYPWMDFHGDEPPWVDADAEDWPEWCPACERPVSETCPACGDPCQPGAAGVLSTVARPERSPGGFQRSGRGQAAEEGST